MFYAQCITYRANRGEIVRCLEDNTARYPALLNQITVKCCLVRMKEQGMTAIVARIPHNEQTPGQFVFELLDMMVNSEMKSMAEEILSYVGTNVGLVALLDDHHERDPLANDRGRTERGR